MNDVLIVVGNKVDTNFFLVHTELEKISKIGILKNLNGNKREQELVSDFKGRVSKDSSFGTRSLGEEGAASKNSLTVYTKEIVSYAKNISDKYPASKVMVVAEPGFLGKLKKGFKTKKLFINKTVSKEVIGLDENNIFSKFGEEIKYI